MTDAAISIDIGGTKIAAALVVDGSIVERHQAKTPRDVSLGLVPVVGQLTSAWLGQNLPVGIATTGIVRDGCITALNPHVLPFPDQFPLRNLLERHFGAPPVIVNDAQAAAWGEYRNGAGVGSRSLAFITISTGVGGGVVLDGQLQRGPTGLAGHFGHTVVGAGGHECGCGRTGCVETIASGSAIARQAGTLLGRRVEAEEVCAEAQRGNLGCEAIVHNAASEVAALCANLKATLDIEKVCIGGGVGLDTYFYQMLADRVLSVPTALRPLLVQASLGSDAGLIGAADVALSGVY